MTMSSQDTFATEQPRPWLRYLALVMMTLLAVFALFYRLDQFPAPWYDEGSHLHVAKNYALHGVYADFSSEGNRPFGPTIGVGPTVLLPIAGLFKLSGVSIPLARVVIAVYGLLALLGFYLLASRLLNFPSLLIAMGLLFFSPGVDFIYHARTVLGEVPGLCFLCAGLWLWLRPGRQGIASLGLVGLLMGLACITKNQLAIFILPAILLNWLADLLWYRRRGWQHFVIPGIVAGFIFAAWTYIVIVRLGEGDNFSENLATLRTASSGAFVVLSQASIERAVRFLVDSSVYSALFIPVFLYGVLLSLRRDEDGQRIGSVMIFIASGILVFGISLGWPRYAFAPVALLAIFTARMIYDITSGLHLDWAGLKATLRGEKPILSVMVIILLVGWAAVSLVLPAYTQLHKVFSGGGGSAYLVADWMNANVPPDAIIETWEQELAVLTDHRYHYPPQIVLAKSVAAQWENGPATRDFYDFRDYGSPDYLIIGTFDKYTDVYVPERRTNYELVTTIGDYDIYKRKSS